MLNFKQWLRFLLILPIALAIFGAGFFTGATTPDILAQAQGRQPRNTEELFTPFWDAWRLVHDRYVDEIDDQKLMEGATSGMLAALGDRHTAYMNPKLFSTLSDDLSGEFEGIGATIRKDEVTGGILIISTITGSPARSSGIKAGDIIITVDGQDITNLTETEVLGMVRGPANTKVTLGLLRKGQRKLIDMTITRARIRIPVVETQLYEGGIGYVRLAEFTDNAMDTLRRELRRMNANKLNGLIFDLRDNPGGGLQTAIDVGSLFIKEGPLVIERGKPGTVDVELDATGRTVAPTVPMVVLINSGSASASELVAGALQDYGRALLVGTQTFGKGSVQIWSELDGGGGVRITIAHFYTPKDRSIHERGLTPDVAVEWDFEKYPNFDPQLAEAFRVLRGEF